MKVTKDAVTGGAAAVSPEDLKLINAWTKKELTAEDVFVFSLKLCDNEVDRDGERFSTGALRELAALFVGKTGIFDHQWSAGGQKARIFKTEVKEEPGRSTVAGESYAYLKAAAYMLRAGNEGLIAEIEGGIKREVSVGCGMGRAVCSVCGEERGSVKCGHAAGAVYDGRTCYFTLEGARDAYEWSFVAVPAQREAGVMKKLGFAADEGLTLMELALRSPAARAELEALQSRAALGERYLNALREEVVTLGVMAQCGLEAETLKSTAAKFSEEELCAFKKAFESRIDELYPPVSQLGLTADNAADEIAGGEAYII